MFNIIVSLSGILATMLFIGTGIFYSVRIVKPSCSREEDLFYSPLLALATGILGVHGWRLDPILCCQQGLLIFTLLVAGWEIIRIRGLVHELLESRKQGELRNRKLINELLLFIEEEKDADMDEILQFLEELDQTYKKTF